MNRNFLQLPDVTLEMMLSDFWIRRVPNPDKPLLSPDKITAFNQHVHEVLDIPPVLDLPDTLSADAVRAQLEAKLIPYLPLYDGHGQPLTDDDIDQYRPQMESDIPATVTTRFGIVVQRASVRVLPTHDVITNKPLQLAFDRFQETTVDMGWPVAAIATSTDKRWVFCLTPLVWGWLPLDVIAFADRETVRSYAEPEKWVRTLAPRGLIGLKTGRGKLSQMGSRLPLTHANEIGYCVQVPQRGPDGDLILADGMVANNNSEFHNGDVPCTVRHIFEAVFASIGEGYSWGGNRLGIFGRDCSRLIKDAYATTGVQLPRNSAQQGRAARTIIDYSDESDTEERRHRLVENGQAGDLLHLPGHVMLYLGHVDGKPYTLHDLGREAMAVVVSTLDLFPEDPRGTLLERLSHVTRIGQEVTP